MSVHTAVGVDAGGTSAVAALSRDGAYAATVRGVPANASTLGVAGAARAIVDAVRAVAGWSGPDALFVGAAGAGRATLRADLAASLAAAFGASTVLAVEDDARVALRAGVPEGPGVVLIAGTGSVAYAECDDVRVRVGGAGYLVGDEGSAFAIGMSAVRRLVRAYDGRDAMDETGTLVAEVLCVDDRDALLDVLYGAPLDVARIAGLAPTVIAAAGRGERSATKIVQMAAQDLGDLVKAAVRLAALGDAAPVVVLSGGLLHENTVLSFLLETRIASDVPGASVLRVRDDPARTALRFAEALVS